MINCKITFFLLLFTGLAFGQSGVKEIKKGQDARQQSFHRGATAAAANENSSKTLFVDPFVGTDAHGHTYPGAAAPFGMMQLSPDTRYEGWDGCSGYHYSDSIIYGFSHTHLSGTGIPDYCDLLIVPQNGVPKTIPGYKNAKEGYGDRFTHDNEKASPGSYEVELLNQKIKVKLVAGVRAGMHEYTFSNAKGKKFILIDLDHRDALLDYRLNVIDKKTVSGARISSSWAKEQHFYFHLETNIPFEKSRIFKTKGDHKLLLTFPSSTEKISIKIGISAVDEAGAKNNLNDEIKDWNMDALRAKTVQAWENELSRIKLETENVDLLTKFYTSLYHSYLQPNIFSDADGRYRGLDKAVHTIENNVPQYTVFSLWDTYRATHPLYTITQQRRTSEFIQTFLRQYQQSGDLPVWELAGNETECMIGYHSVSVIADAYVKGLRNFDADLALAAAQNTSKLNEFGKTFFRNNGFIGSGDEHESVSKNLEFAYDDFCIAELAKAMGKTDIAKEYTKNSLNFINSFDQNSKFMRARNGGIWHSPFDPAEVNFNYTEANSWQYSLYAPHAVDVLTELMGGKDSLEAWLDRLFTTKSDLSGREQVDITGLIGQYAHGNEPSHHMAYLYNYTNAPHKTQEYTDRIMREMYTTLPDGLSGNEDCGQMSSWFVLSSMGIYQIAPGSSFFDFGRPLMDKASIQLENGKRLIIKTRNNSKENIYIQKVYRGEMPFEGNKISYENLMMGGELIFEMGPKPAKIATNSSAIGSKDLVVNEFVPVPSFKNETRTFTDFIVVQTNKVPLLDEKRVEIEFRYVDDIERVYKFVDSLRFSNSKSIDIRTVYHPSDKAMLRSAWVRGEFIKLDPSTHMELKSNYANQYPSTGANALIDGISGKTDYRTGEYQGYWENDVVAEVSFDNGKVLSEIGIGCLQDMKSWIFLPSKIKIDISYDGLNFSPMTDISVFPAFSNYQSPSRYEFTQQTKNTAPIKKVRISVLNHGITPTWHESPGNSTWLFVDELIFR
ncbi:MAG: GH92 family glycosyl hydrolase [Bacteroidota bacterium]